MKQAPLAPAAHEVVLWCLRVFRLETELDRQVQRLAFEVNDAVLLALVGRERKQQVALADDRSRLLRARLRVAADLGRIEDRQLVHANGLLASIGRQLGGWSKGLSPTPSR